MVGWCSYHINPRKKVVRPMAALYKQSQLCSRYISMLKANISHKDSVRLILKSGECSQNPKILRNTTKYPHDENHYRANGSLQVISVVTVL